MEPSPLRLALIGCGNIWRGVYHPVIASMKDRARITAVCDISSNATEEAAALLPGVHRYSDPGKLFHDEALDAAVVLTSEKANAAVARAALRAGLGVFLEKPPGVSVAEWRNLLEAAEAATKGGIYTAFNRRHVPLFRNWRLPEGSRLRNVRGVLLRRGRALSTFPFTAVHLIDSVQYFAGRLFAEARAFLNEGKDRSFWQVRGRLESGAICNLTLAPDGASDAEHLVFETEDKIWELHFPHSESSAHPEGLLVSRPVGSASRRDGVSEFIRSDPGLDVLDALGHRSNFNNFLARIEDGAWAASPHHLRHCGVTIALLEEMLDQTARAAPGRTRGPAPAQAP
jgi:virulence factor